MDMEANLTARSYRLMDEVPSSGCPFILFWGGIDQSQEIYLYCFFFYHFTETTGPDSAKKLKPDANHCHIHPFDQSPCSLEGLFISS